VVRAAFRPSLCGLCRHCSSLDAEQGGAASSPHVHTRCDVHNSILEDSSYPRPPPCGLGSLRGGPARTSERGALGAARVSCWALWILQARPAVLRRTLRAASRHAGMTNAARASRVCVSPKGAIKGLGAISHNEPNYQSDSQHITQPLRRTALRFIVSL
jgi:hypothetical protein